MELPNIGQQCSHLDCKQLDFLPLQCKCLKIFCSTHFNAHVATCKECLTEAAVVEHQNVVFHRCSHKDCKETSLVPLICVNCKQHFCIQHRHFDRCEPEDPETIAKLKEKHAAPVREFNKAKSILDQSIERRLEDARKKGRNVTIVNKVQLMKIKAKAKGPNSIPIADRIYFSIYTSSHEGLAIFVSKNWSVGRAIDSAANECNLRNDNNKNTETKLRFLKKESNEPICKDVSTVLNQLLNDGFIVNGENLVLDYVSTA